MRLNRIRQCIVLSVMILFMGSMVATLFADKEDVYRSIRKNFTLFNRIFETVSSRYVEEVDIDELMQASIKGMLDTLDPYTVYMERDQYDELKIGTQGKFEGLGINIGIRDGVLTVISPIEGTPAHRVGIQAGDKVVKIEGESTKGFSTAKAASLLRGPKGTEVTITIEREAVPDPIDYTITRDVVEVKSISYAGVLSDSIGYIRLRKFSQESGQEVKDALEGVIQQGIKGLIFDLRMNSGGLLSEAVDVTDKFLPKESLIVSTKGRNGQGGVEYRAQEDPVYGDQPLVVLVDQGSASASEIFAGAIQDWDRGLIVGTTTFGKGLVQSIMPLGEEEALKITTAKYYTPSGRCIQKDDLETGEAPAPYFTLAGRPVHASGGISPDIDVEAPALNRLESELLRKGMFMSFAANFTAAHPDLGQDFEVDQNMMIQFKDFALERGLSYEPAGMAEIEKLRETVHREHYSSDIDDRIDQLEKQLESEKEGDFDRSAEFIRNRLQAQIALDLWGADREAQILLQDDPQVAYAMDMLHHLDLYYDNLAGVNGVEK